METIDWVAVHILPHEAALRRWLGGFVEKSEIEDIVQEAFCHIAELSGVAHIQNPRRYLFQAARNIVLESFRRAQIVRIEAIGGVQELEDVLGDTYDALSPERIVAYRAWLARIDALVAKLPARAISVFKLRKVEGLSQREVAKRLGVTEAVVENDLTRGLSTILAALGEDERAELSVITNRGKR